MAISSKKRIGKTYKDCIPEEISNLWIVNMLPGDLVVAGCFNFLFSDYGGFL